MKNILWLALWLSVLCVSPARAESLPPKHFSHPDRVRYDGDCFTIEGRDVFVFSAAFHYFRVPEALWRDRFRRIKEAGFNTVETYVPWNWHERNAPRNVNNFSQFDFTDLKAWLKMAHEEFGLYTIVRPGPFICAEWAGGAYPRWLAKYCPEKYDTSFWLRSNHPEHLKWTRHWYKAVCDVFAPEQLSRKQPGEKGIIMVQLENEYIYFGMSSEKKEEVLRALSSYCAESGIDVPLMTCVTPEVRGSKDPVVSQIFDMDNQYVWWNMHEAKSRIEDLKRRQPNAPAMVCELQGGWFSTVGGGLSEDSYLDGRHARGMALMAMAGGATGLNYYMFFGGTHFAGWGARNMTTTYDYGAALKENGGVGEKYAAVKGVGEFLNRYGADLARTTEVAFDANANEQLTMGLRKAKDGTRFLFVLNKDAKRDFRAPVRIAPKEGGPFNVYVNLGPRDSRVLVVENGADEGEWYPKAQSLPRRPTNLPMPLRIATAQKHDEPATGEWEKWNSGRSLPEMDVNDCRYSRYRTQVKLSEKDLKNYGTLLFEMFTGDPMYVSVNGKPAPRASADELDNTFNVAGLLKPGSNEILAIYENRGHAHGYRPMEELSGMRRGGLGGHQTGILPVESWQVKKMPENFELDKELRSTEGWERIELDRETIGALATLQIAGLEKPKWPAAWVLQGTHGKALYRTTVDFTPEMIGNKTTMLEFACVDDGGTLYVNGKKVASHDAWDKPFLADLAGYIRPGKNEIAILVSNGSGAGGVLGAVRLSKRLTIDRPLKWEADTELGGVRAGFILPQTNTADWQKVNLQTSGTLPRKGGANVCPEGTHDGLLTWYRVSFRLPPTKRNVWVPWRAIINASGTGYMWLNGHNIGRYWEQGPQREYYLPECWLNAEGENVLVLGLRQSEGRGGLLNGVEIAPYYEEAEIR